MTRVRHLLGGALARTGFELRRLPDPARLTRTHADLEEPFAAALGRALPQSMTSVERMYALWQATGHIVRHQIPGDIVEAGVWRGGSSMMAALALTAAGDTSRTMWLYDTFEGMSEPTEFDVAVTTNQRMDQEWDAHKGAENDPIFAYGPLSVVQENMRSTAYPADQIRYVKGKVEDTIPGEVPEQIALLRLDTDWYESTKHELEHLWDRLSPGGVLIIDDYGYWAGARQAVDEFFDGRADAPLLNRIDDTGRIAVKR